VKVTPTLQHLELIAFRHHLEALQSWRVALPQAQVLEEFIASHALLREGARSLRAGRAWLFGVLLGLMLALRERQHASSLERECVKRAPEARERATWHEGAHHAAPNVALRFSKSCVLWLRFLS
jgi:hypothetical protein